jgi:AmmeMemoRadiSam system protein A
MEFVIEPEEKRILLAGARESIASKLENRPLRWENEAAAIPESSVLRRPCGAFVTLHGDAAGGRRLRGCIGRMNAAEPLEQTVRLMAREAAFGDPRFPPLSAAEFPRCSIEISVLSPLESCIDPRRVKVGIHGLYLSYRGRAGVLLPQVSVEQGWNLDEYLDYICTKAGLPPGAYRENGARLFTFTAEVFGDP